MPHPLKFRPHERGSQECHLKNSLCNVSFTVTTTETFTQEVNEWKNEWNVALFSLQFCELRIINEGLYTVKPRLRTIT